MLPDQTETYFFPPSRKRWSIVFCGALFFVFFNGFVAVSSGTQGLFFLSAFFGLFCLIALVNLLPGGGGLYLERDGFSYRVFYKERRYRWDEVGAFHPTSNGLLAHIGFRKLDDLKKAAGKPTPGELLPETYGLKAQHLAALLNAWRDYRLSGQYRMPDPDPVTDGASQPA